MNITAMMIAGFSGLAIAWVVAGPKWGITIGSIATAVAGIATLTATDSLAAPCSYYTGALRASCIEPTWWELHGNQAIGIGFIALIVAGTAWSIPSLIKAFKAA